MTKWEYRQLNLNLVHQRALLQEWGEHGWELVAIEQGWGWFKRPLPKGY